MEANEVGRKWIFEDKAIGRLTQLHMKVWGNVTPGGKYYETPWRKAPGYQGGFVLDGGVHHIALIRYVSGEEIVETQGNSIPLLSVIMLFFHNKFCRLLQAGCEVPSSY